MQKIFALAYNMIYYKRYRRGLLHNFKLCTFSRGKLDYLDKTNNVLTLFDRLLYLGLLVKC